MAGRHVGLGGSDRRSVIKSVGITGDDQRLDQPSSPVSPILRPIRDRHHHHRLQLDCPDRGSTLIVNGPRCAAVPSSPSTTAESPTSPPRASAYPPVPATNGRSSGSVRTRTWTQQPAQGPSFRPGLTSSRECRARGRLPRSSRGPGSPPRSRCGEPSGGVGRGDLRQARVQVARESEEVFPVEPVVLHRDAGPVLADHGAAQREIRSSGSTRRSRSTDRGSSRARLGERESSTAQPTSPGARTGGEVGLHARRRRSRTPGRTIPARAAWPSRVARQPPDHA